VLNRVFIGRAWEVFEAAQRQYPEEMKRIEEVLVQLISEGKIEEKISGEELYSFFHQLGLRIRLKTHIQFMEHARARTELTRNTKAVNTKITFTRKLPKLAMFF
jgi:hypothetical protein